MRPRQENIQVQEQNKEMGQRVANFLWRLVLRHHEKKVSLSIFDGKCSVVLSHLNFLSFLVDNVFQTCYLFKLFDDDLET